MKLCVSPYFWTNKWNNRVQSASFLEQEMRPLALRQRNLSFQVDGWSEVKKGVSDPRVCCQLCQNHGGCKAWLWSEWSTEAHGMACILKGGQVGSEGPLKYLLSHHFRGYDTPRLVLWMFYGNDNLGIPQKPDLGQEQTLQRRQRERFAQDWGHQGGWDGHDQDGSHAELVWKNQVKPWHFREWPWWGTKLANKVLLWRQNPALAQSGGGLV